MRVSVITPSFNQGVFIERTLQSVAMQGHELPGNVTLEHRVFDGGSTDNTVDILKSFPTVNWVSKKDKGQTDAVNQGISATAGDIIGWLNSDDVYYPGAIARVIAFFDEHPEIDVVYGQADHIDSNDNAFETYPSEPWCFERLKEVCFICQPALFFRRRVIEEHGLLDGSLNYCMDYEYWLRLGKAGVKFAYLEEKLAGSRLYKDNKTLGARISVHQEINDMLKKKFDHVPDRWLFNYAHTRVENKIIREKNPVWFNVRLFCWSIYAAWHWNRNILSVIHSPLISWRHALGLAKLNDLRLRS